MFTKETDSQVFPQNLNLVNLQKRKEQTIEEHTCKYVYIQQNCALLIGNISMFSENSQPYHLLEKIKTDGPEDGSYEDLWD